ncbi:LysR family transcriptional regulator [Halobacteriovorax sp. HLS]|uniref:LysR family transcriptional regulator n=1 Tax=Halobacteriovorax sp. HLS TaxID=2234000 RepID=UPI000FD7517A|nr:LysR family transcriptional regulator [Halobacteriovorax sp. HLS]
MNIRNFDLNLLVVLNDFNKTNSMSKTAVNLGLSQPAVSHALKRLRESLGDDLFVRTGKHYSPTEKGKELSAFVESHLRDLEQTLFKSSEWSPHESDKHFTLSGTSYDSFTWFPSLMQSLKLDAPKVNMTFRGIVIEEFLERMISSEVDLSFAGNLEMINNFTIETLGERHFSLIASNSSRRYTKNISLKTYLEAQHVLYTPTEKPGSDVDKLLKKMGHRRNITIRTSYLNSIPMLVSQRDFLSIVPTFFAKKVAKLYGLKVLNVPFEIPAFRHQMIWHKSKDNSSSHLWLRNYIKDNYKDFMQ